MFQSNTAQTSGTMMPMVPQEVPVAKPMKQATMKITAGRNLARLPVLAMTPSTKAPTCRPLSRHRPHRVQAKQRIRMGEIIWMKPLGMASMDFSKVMRPRSQ